MLRMLRFRRYRVFLAFAALASLLLLRYSPPKNWDRYVLTDSLPGQSPPKQDGLEDSKHLLQPLQPPNGNLEADKPGPGNVEATSKKAAVQTPPPKLSSTSTSRAATHTLPHVVLPDRTRPLPKVDQDGGLTDDIHPIGQPGRQELPIFTAVPTTIRWEKQIEHFPVPTESLIRLPTGVPAKIPKIQHAFNDETPDAKINREKRQKKVREEFQKAWNGYKQHAWLHDELSPTSGNFRDPFCGWAATLVDSLDTLWIMGLQEEFEDAARAVDLIDFTTSPRGDIPVFETTIRYLGGLLAAYDVSGGIYSNLLTKAVELADILMGAFDTPNRMPVLYYRWKPTFASQPHRASQRSSLAEIGSLSVEFTRLAQLTKEPRYYDAVARITNALSEWQDRGTKLDGVFPDNIDASGCNRSLPVTFHQTHNADSAPVSPEKIADPPRGFEPTMPKTVAEPRPKKKNIKGQGPADLELQILPGQPSNAQIIEWDNNSAKRGLSKRDLGSLETSNIIAAQAEAPIPQDVAVADKISDRTEPVLATDPITGLPRDISAAKSRIGTSLGDWDCTPQGLDSASLGGRNKFSMGGGQDSTYEYFPKQYLLLGGREDKYRKMYLKTIDAVRQWMLYRPMLPDNRDILFSGSVTTDGNPETDLKLNAEVEHLTCFIGGMVGMGAKIFGLEGDLEIAMKLADGCVWAYESTASGIMPEGATVLPCESPEHCTWNETAYWEYLDPLAGTRDELLAAYIENKASMAEERRVFEEEAAKKAEENRLAAQSAADIPLRIQKEGLVKDEVKAKSTTLLNSNHTTEPLPKSQPVSLQKRQSSPKDDLPKPFAHNFKDDINEVKNNYRKDTASDPGTLEGVSSPPSNAIPQDKIYMEKAVTTEAELRGMPSGRQAEVPILEQPTIPAELLPDPLRPLSHKEYVEARIEQEALPAGYVSIRGRKYILRPEAIESVWYMYRITGDSSWQDKGWKMFESVIKHTSAEYGHSAIYDVTMPEPYQTDEMESFWLAETLKYFYLLYSTPDTISLDEWVLNTEAHPFKREV